MTIKHYIVFVGADKPLSTELLKIEKRLPSVKIIAPAMGNSKTEVNEVSSKVAIENLYKELAASENLKETARLSVWFYQPTDESQIEHIWEAFGHSAWVQMIPRSYLDKHNPTATREFIEGQVGQVLSLLHVLYRNIYGSHRRNSPLMLPLRNFKSPLANSLKQHWYNELNEDDLKKKIKSYKSKYALLKSAQKQGYLDEKSLIFAPAKNDEMHGIIHPTGATPKSFTCGKFRYGVALYPGFHFDVSAEKTPTIQCVLYDSTGKKRYVMTERLRHINISPNDHLRPEK